MHPQLGHAMGHWGLWGGLTCRDSLVTDTEELKSKWDKKQTMMSDDAKGLAQKGLVTALGSSPGLMSPHPTARRRNKGLTAACG